jgi:hypothetical protein
MGTVLLGQSTTLSVVTPTPRMIFTHGWHHSRCYTLTIAVGGVWAVLTMCCCLACAARTKPRDHDRLWATGDGFHDTHLELQRVSNPLVQVRFHRHVCHSFASYTFCVSSLRLLLCHRDVAVAKNLTVFGWIADGGSRGARYVEMMLDDVPIFKGEVKRAPGGILGVVSAASVAGVLTPCTSLCAVVGLTSCCCPLVFSLYFWPGCLLGVHLIHAGRAHTYSHREVRQACAAVLRGWWRRRRWRRW